MLLVFHQDGGSEMRSFKTLLQVTSQWLHPSFIPEAAQLKCLYIRPEPEAFGIFGNTNIKKHPSIYRSKSMFFSMFRLWSWTLDGQLEDAVTPHWDKYICKHVLNVYYTSITLYADIWQDPTSGMTPSVLLISFPSLNSHPVNILYVFPLITS